MSKPRKKGIPSRPAVQITGGMSAWGSVSVNSDSFQATAYHKDGKEMVSIQPIPKALSFILKLKRWYIPRTLQLAAFMVSGISTSTWITYIVTFALLQLLVYPHLPPRHIHVSTTLESVSLSLLIWATLGILARLTIAPWHAAEHMAIAAYKRSQSTTIKNIRKENRVDPSCGGRFALPLIIASTLATFSTHKLGTNFWLIYLILVEITLQIDTYIGLDKLAPFKQASHALQRYVTTTEPNEAHLRTAKLAIEALVWKHSQTSEQ